MKSKLSQWFECKVKYDKTMENGQIKKVTEQYVVEAFSFSEAEQRITEYMSQYISGEYEVTGVSKASYREVFFNDDSDAEKWYKAKLQFLMLDEKSGTEKKSNQFYLLQSRSFDEAVSSIGEIMSGTTTDYVTANVSETAILEVIEI